MNTIQFFASRNCSEIIDPIDVSHRPAGTTLFELHMDLVDIGNGQAVWAGSLQKMHNGKKRYFQGWSGLIANLQMILTPPAQFRVLQELMAAEIASESMQDTH